MFADGHSSGVSGTVVVVGCRPICGLIAPGGIAVLTGYGGAGHGGAAGGRAAGQRRRGFGGQHGEKQAPVHGVEATFR
ncbi:hypothetical protein FXW78_25270 [Rhodococcus opacus]|nr:hypothetical protein [Rhodococcus opacus]